MSKPRKPTSPEHAKLPIRFTRRTTLRMLGTAFATTPLTAALGCAGPQQAPSAEPDEPSNARASTQPMAAAPVSNSPSQAATSSNARTAKPSAAQVAGASAQPSSGAMPGGSNNAAAGAGNLGPSTPSMQGQAPNGMSAQAGAAGQASSAQAGASATAPTLASGWAMGGTAALANAGSYPSPFESKLDASCVRTEPMTLGPCHDNQAPEREDISEKQPGLPMRFGLRIVNEKCEPISNANVDIWHCDTQGVYSSETSDFASFCTGNDAEAQPAHWFRGYRQVDETGTVWFNTCFPGWYESRALHIHVTVRRMSRQGMEALTTQLGFDPKLGDEICSTHPDYKSHGKPETSNSADNTFQGTGYLLETKRMPDGVMLAWKTLVIPS